MPRPIPAADAAPYPGARFATSIVAANVAGYRRAASPTMRQTDLAERMSALGHPWTQAVVSIVETEQRHVTVDELLALAIALGVTVPALLDPAGVSGTDERHVGLLPAGETPPADDDREGQLLIPPTVPNALARAMIAGKAIVRLEPRSAEAFAEVADVTPADAEAAIRSELDRDLVPFQLAHAPAPRDRTPSYAEAADGEPRALAFMSVRKEHRR